MKIDLGFMLLFIAAPLCALGEARDFVVLHGECLSGNRVSCLDAGKVSSKEKNFRSAADVFSKGCSLGSTESCGLQVKEEAKDGNFDGFSKAVADACDAGHKKYCSLSDRAKLNLFDKDLKAADPELYKVWLNGGRLEVLEKVDRERGEEGVAEWSRRCDGGRTSSCIQAGKALLANESFREALEALEKACDQKSSEACELAGLAASKLDQGDYAMSLTGIACRLGRLSACRAQGKIKQEVVDRDRSNQEVEGQRRADASRLAEEKKQERLAQLEREKANAALSAAGVAIGQAISGGQAPKSKNTRRCTQKKSPFGGEWETVCEDSDY